MNINNFHGMSQAEIEGRIASAAMKSALWGVPLMMYFHTFSNLTDTEIGWIMDDMEKYGIPCDMATLTNYIRSGENIEGDYYVKAPDSNVDFDLSSLSFLIDNSGRPSMIFSINCSCNQYNEPGMTLLVYFNKTLFSTCGRSKSM